MASKVYVKRFVLTPDVNTEITFDRPVEKVEIMNLGSGSVNINLYNSIPATIDDTDVHTFELMGGISYEKEKLSLSAISIRGAAANKMQILYEYC